MLKEGSSSPWGKIQHVEALGRGACFVSTASHGGIKLDRVRNAMVPKAARRERGWYEEDCEVAIPLAVHEDIRLRYGVSREKALESVQRWLPEDYAALTAS